MGVVKNLMVRIVGDASGIVKAMKNAGSATSKASEKIKNSSANMKRSVKDSFSGSRMSVRQYSEYVAKTKQDHETATQNVERLSDKVGQMQSVYDSIKTATAGLDLSKPLEEMIVEAEKNLTQIESRARKVEKELASLSNSRGGGNSKKTAALQAELKTLSEKSQFAVMRLEHLNQVADKIGTKNIKFASNAGLKQLETDIHNVRNELNGAQLKANETGQRLRSMGIAPTLKYVLKNIGTDAAKAASGGVKRLGTVLKNLGGGAARGIASLPGKLLRIGKSASAGCGGLNRMVRSIRNIGIVSLGMRVASGMFGQLRSIISSYISQNEALNASVTNMKNQLGAALAPAINIVIAALQRLMPIVVAVSNAINSIFTALFGKVASTTSAIKSSANAAGSAASSLETYGFDQITKVSDNSGGGGSGSSGASAIESEQSGLVQKLTAWIQQLKTAFVAGDWQGLGKIVGDGLNNAIDSINAVDIGSKAGTIADNVVTVLHSAFSTANFTGVGEKAGQMLTTAMEQVNWTKAGDTIGKALTALLYWLDSFSKQIGAR